MSLRVGDHSKKGINMIFKKLFSRKKESISTANNNEAIEPQEPIEIDPGESKLYASARSYTAAGTEIEDGTYVSVDEIVALITEILSPILEKYGFKYLKSKKTYKRKTPTGVDEIYLNFYNYLHYELQIHFDKRIDAVQKIITQFNYENDYNTISDYKQFHTVHGFYPEFDKIKVITKGYLQKKIKEAADYIEQIVIPSFENTNSIEGLNTVFNYPEQCATDPLNYYSRNKIGSYQIEAMVLAHLTHDQEIYDQVLKHFLKMDDEYEQEKTLKLDNFLKEKYT